MHSARWLLAFALTVGSLTAHAEELALPDGSRWSLDGTTLRHGAISATLKVHTVGIDCATGLASKSRVDAAYLPPRFLAVEEPDGAATRATVCIDAGGAAVVATLKWPGALVGPDRDAVRALLDYFGQAAAAAGTRSSPGALALFRPPVAQVPLTASTGAWDFVVEGTTSTSTVVVQQWPLPHAMIMLRLDRSPATQRCDSVGFSGSRPAWAPALFAPLGAVREGMSIACLDGADGHLLLAAGVAAIPPDGQVRIRALLEAIATTLGSAPVAAVTSGPPPAAIAPPSPSAYTAPTLDTPPTSTDTSSADGPPRPRRPLASYLRGFSVAVHQLSPSAEDLEDGYGVALAYRRMIARRGTLIPRIAVQGGYDNLSKWMADVQFALGARLGDWEDSIAAQAAVGFDGIGLGEDTTSAGPVYVPGELYLGGQVSLDLGGISAALGYYARNTDAIGSEWRFEIGYAIAPGRRLLGRYTSYANAGSQLSLALAF